MYKAPLDTQDPRLLKRAKTAFLRNQFLAHVIASASERYDGWRWPRIKLPSRVYPHHSKKECERRCRQPQHCIQMRIDRYIKRWPDSA